CMSRDEVARFYRRHGGYLALLYMLAAADFHHENVIAAGEHPVLIDLEALFHPQEPPPEKPTSDHAVGQAFDESVLAASLLPLRERSHGRSEDYDMSGMGAEPGQKLPWRYPTWEGLGTDEMHLVRKDDVIDSAEHLPALNGVAARLLDFVDEIEGGFREMYELLYTQRAELLAPGGPLDRFAADEVRVILRATNRYGELLDEGCHPDLLRDALDRDRHFDRLWEEVQMRQMLEALVHAEVEDLWNGDIPLFTTRPQSRDLWNSTGRRFADVHHESGMESARRRIAGLGADDLERQTWFLRAALATLPNDDIGARSGYHLVEGGSGVDRERLLTAARAVADRLEEEALRGTDDVNWIGLTPADEDRWSLVPLGTDLYDGLPGVILFLAHLGKITAQERYTGLARAAFKTLRRRLAPDKRQKAVGSIGGFSGWGGIIYTLANLAVVWNEPQLLAEAEALVAVLSDLIAQDKELDIISGAAGCVAGLLCLHELKPSRTVLAAAVQCGEHLLSRARSMPQGLGWDPSQSRATPLTGFSHGAAGISWGLAKLATQTGEERFRQAALEGIAYERSLFLAEEGNWPDLRPDEDSAVESSAPSPSCMTAWCHGAPGIGLARLGCLPHLDDPMLHSEIKVALGTTLRSGFGRNHSLCHGDLGNLELLLCAAREYPNSPWPDHVNRLAAGILNSIERDGWRCPSPLGVESPGLMTGYTGIGYALLRLAEPDKVTSVLTLAPPYVDATASRSESVASRSRESTANRLRSTSCN
ncbi:MAG: type 2 lanthipeptide synthetase LanM family protein, partial [Planctomycetaceae bacterium]